MRFDALVKSSGQPELVTLWTKPEEDAEFMKAVKQNRAATIFQANVGTKKDFGVVGLETKKNASYMVFPKKIPNPEGTKIIGIKYERIAESQPKGAVFKPKRKSSPGIPMREKPRYTLEESQSKATSKRKTVAAREPKTFTFKAVITLTATQSTTLKVEAVSVAAAKKMVRAQVDELELDPARSKILRKIGKVTKTGSG